MPVAAAANWSKSQTISAETMGPQILVDIVVFVAVIVDGRPKMDCCHGHKFTVALLFFHFFSPSVSPFFALCQRPQNSNSHMARKTQSSSNKRSLWNSICICIGCVCVSILHTGSSVHLMHEFRAILRWSTLSAPQQSATASHRNVL